VTPHTLIEGIITEKGIIRKPYGTNLKKMFTKNRVQGIEGSRKTV